MEILITIVILLALGLLGGYKGRNDCKNEMEQKGMKQVYFVHFIGGHPYFTPNIDMVIVLMNDKTLRLEHGGKSEIVLPQNIESCIVESSEQIKNNATLAKTMIFGVSALKDTVSGVQYMSLTYKLENQSITCMFKASNNFNPYSKKNDDNIAETSFEINKLVTQE